MLTAARWRAPAAVASVLVAGALLGIGGAWEEGTLTQAEIGVCLDADGHWMTYVTVEQLPGKQTPLLYVRAICIEVL